MLFYNFPPGTCCSQEQPCDGFLLLAGSRLACCWCTPGYNDHEEGERDSDDNKVDQPGVLAFMNTWYNNDGIEPEDPDN